MTYAEAIRILKQEVNGDLPIDGQTIINRTMQVESLLLVIEAAERYVDLCD